MKDTKHMFVGSIDSPVYIEVHSNRIYNLSLSLSASPAARPCTRNGGYVTVKIY